MFLQDKKSPTLVDYDLMPFGKYKGRTMADVPASYLMWLWDNGCDNELVKNYIHNSMDAIKQELGDRE